MVFLESFKVSEGSNTSCTTQEFMETFGVKRMQTDEKRTRSKKNVMFFPVCRSTPASVSVNTNSSYNKNVLEDFLNFI